MEEIKCIELCKHAIGMGLRKPYKRHGKTFYKPYRNYFCTSEGCDDYKHWESLEAAGYAKSIQREEHGKMFWMTRAGMDWLGKRMNMHIYDEED